MLTRKNLKVAAMRRFIVALAVACIVILCSCGDGDKGRFKKAMAAGELTEAQGYIAEIDNRRDVKECALQLMKAYLKLDMPDKAIDVYENVTPWHKERFRMQFYGGNYEREACRMLREYLMAHGQYEKAWNYYQLEYDDENYIGNAPCRFGYLTDAVAAMCAKGEQEEAARFVEAQVRWFVVNVDSNTGEDVEEQKANFGSDIVRQRLMEQIDNSY